MADNNYTNSTSSKGNVKYHKHIVYHKYEKQQKDTSYINVSSWSMFSLILISLIIIALAQFLNSGTSDISFLSFLEFLSNAPSFDVSWSMIELSIVGDWGMFDFLRTFINYFTSIFEVLILIFGFLVETIEYVFYFVRGLLFP